MPKKSGTLFEVFLPLLKGEDVNGLWDGVGKPLVHYKITKNTVQYTHLAGLVKGKRSRMRIQTDPWTVFDWLMHR